MSDSGSRSLTEDDLGEDPFVAFGRWFDEAAGAGEAEPEAMALATATRSGQPSLRWVLLKSWDRRGFVFYTNYDSPKSRDLSGNPVAALAWRWRLLGRQVRVQGGASRLTPEESDAYFATRERPSQIAAWASKQSAVIPTRSVLERRVHDLEEGFAGGEVPRPAGWGGWRVEPHTMEFWQNRPNRLHDRIRYRAEGGGWIRERLSP